MVDTTELENCLISFGKVESKIMTSYISFVGKTFSKTKSILKLLSMPNETFIENFTKFFEDASLADVEKLLPIKGIKKQDVPNFISKFLK